MQADFTKVGEWYHNYIRLAEQLPIAEAFEKGTKSFISFLGNIPEEKTAYRYASGKWSIKEILLHITDAERIFAYRALSVARKETASLPGFDENSYAANSMADSREWNDLINEFVAVRQSTELLFRSFTLAQLLQSGTASASPTYVLGLGYIIIGHSMHHKNIIEQRYL